MKLAEAMKLDITQANNTVPISPFPCRAKGKLLACQAEFLQLKTSQRDTRYRNIFIVKISIRGGKTLVYIYYICINSKFIACLHS